MTVACFVSGFYEHIGYRKSTLLPVLIAFGSPGSQTINTRVVNYPPASTILKNNPPLVILISACIEAEFSRESGISMTDLVQNLPLNKW
eukprot:CAMPEP_0117810542 /NCGR_PEP_ID=MMETSP0948-20121206/21495_1 /TAXON_ID=44440 /ORGANISM="Chattonella subsalsa, Strain CCMP2191" /LENGTH=88 /DNA_ID=CAMNT_0005646767 /DNA_START=170 /DNA_END=436 /DNA_ORIENTATION=-